MFEGTLEWNPCNIGMESCNLCIKPQDQCWSACVVMKLPREAGYGTWHMCTYQAAQVNFGVLPP